MQWQNTASGSTAVPRTAALARIGVAGPGGAPGEAGAPPAAGPRLTVLRAPAGFGKSVLIAQWLDAIGTLGTHGTAPEQAVFRWPDAGAGTDTGASEADRIRDALADGTRVFVIDDMDRAPEDVVDACRRLVDIAPAGTRVLLASREALPFSVAAMEAAGDAVQIGPDTLAFSADETGALLSFLMASPERARTQHLTADTIEVVHRLSGGWPIAAALIGRAACGHGEHALMDARDDIAAYVLTEIQRDISAEARTLAALVDALPIVTTGMLNAVLPSGNSAESITEALARMLIVRDRDRSRDLFRVHPLLVDRLAGGIPPSVLRDAAVAAVRWYRDRGDSVAALLTAIRSAAHIGQQETEAILAEGTLGIHSEKDRATMARIIREESPDLIRHGPSAQLFLAGAELSSGRLEAALVHLAQASSESGDVILAARADILRASVALVTGDLPAARRFVEASYPALDNAEPLRLAAAEISLAVAALWSEQGDGPHAAVEGFRRAARLARAGGSRGLSRQAATQAAIALRLAGDAAAAEDEIRELITGMDGDDDPETRTVAYAELSSLQRARGAISDAADSVEVSQNALAQGVSSLARWWSGCELVRVRIAAGDTDAAERTLRRLERSTSAIVVPPWFRHESGALRGCIAAAAVDRTAFERWHDRQDFEGLRAQALFSAPVWIAAAFGSRIFGLDPSPDWASAASGVAVSLRAAGHHLRARQLSEALKERATREGPRAPLRQRSEAAVPVDTGIREEQLSEREREVLQALADGYSNETLAEHLFVSRNTIKTHLKHVYAKLGVTNRTQAVAVGRARALLRD